MSERVHSFAEIGRTLPRWGRTAPSLNAAIDNLSPSSEQTAVLCAMFVELENIRKVIEQLPQAFHELTPEGRAETKAKEEAEAEDHRLWAALSRRIHIEIGQLALPQRCKSPMFDHFHRENCAPRWQVKPEDEWIFVLPAMLGKTPGTKIRASYEEWLKARKDKDQ